MPSDHIETHRRARHPDLMGTAPGNYP